MAMLPIIDYVISYEDGLYLVMQLYSNRQWDTYSSFENAYEAIVCMRDMLKTLEGKNEQA